MKLLIATDLDFWNADKGSRKRIFQLCSFLTGTEHEIFLFLAPGVTQFNAEETATAGQRFGFKDVRSYVPAKPAWRLERFVGSCCRGIKMMSGRHWGSKTKETTLADFKDNQAKKQFVQFVKEVSPDFVLIEYIRLAYLIDSIPRGIKTIIDTHDVMHLRYESFKAAGKPHWLKISEREERAVLNQFDAVIAIQEKEKSYFRKQLAAQTRVLQAGMDTSFEFLPESKEDILTLGFIGANGLPNSQGISAFVENIWPRLLDLTARKIKLQIAGSICGVLATDAFGPQVEMLGRVDDLKSFYQTASIIINPVMFGGGLKIKSVEALAFGKPLVSTTVGIMGLEEGAGKAFLVAENDDEFLEHLVRLIESDCLRSELAEGAFDFARKHFSAEVIYRELSDYLGLE